MNYNKALFAGRVVRDCTLKYLPSQSAVCNFTVCSNHNWKDKSGQVKEDACFLDCVAFGAKAENINRFFSKGKSIFVEGRLKYESWEKDGAKRSKIVLVVESWSFVEPSSADGPKHPSPSPGPDAKAHGGEPSPVGEDDIPF